MNEPSPLGPIVQLLGGNAADESFSLLMGKGWHNFVVYGKENTREAGLWCLNNIKHKWTFFLEYGNATFYIEDGKDAMLFKLTWCLAMKKREPTF